MQAEHLPGRQVLFPGPRSVPPATIAHKAPVCVGNSSRPSIRPAKPVKFASHTPSVLVRISHERTNSYRRFCREGLQSGAIEATSALYANLAKPYFAGFYAKLLIPRLGT